MTLREQSQKVQEKEDRATTVRNDAGLSLRFNSESHSIITSVLECLLCVRHSSKNQEQAMSSRLDPCFLGDHIEKVYIMLGPVGETP